MQTYEIEPILKSNYCDRESWEQTRYLIGVIINMFGSKKIKKLTDIVEFPWDEEKGKPLTYDDALKSGMMSSIINISE